MSRHEQQFSHPLNQDWYDISAEVAKVLDELRISYDYGRVNWKEKVCEELVSLLAIWLMRLLLIDK